jgi:hypothetical protein
VNDRHNATADAMADAIATPPFPCMPLKLSNTVHDVLGYFALLEVDLVAHVESLFSTPSK